jgi:hypothetical protein
VPSLPRHPILRCSIDFDPCAAVGRRPAVSAKARGQLESKLQSIRKITDAKSVLMNSRKISEEDAYAAIRDQAMVKRVSIEEIATAIVNANEILSTVGIKP